VISWSKQYNCASYAVERLNELHGLDIKVGKGNEWQASFIPFMRKYFKPSPVKVEGCLVVMTALNGCMHLGVYENYMITHNYKTSGGAGSVIKSDLGTIRTEFKERIRFYVVN
jgi:hypothetical protein